MNLHANNVSALTFTSNGNANSSDLYAIEINGKRLRWIAMSPILMGSK